MTIKCQQAIKGFIKFEKFAKELCSVNNINLFPQDLYSSQFTIQFDTNQDQLQDYNINLQLIQASQRIQFSFVFKLLSKIQILQLTKNIQQYSKQQCILQLDQQYDFSETKLDVLLNESNQTNKFYLNKQNQICLLAYEKEFPQSSQLFVQILINQEIKSNSFTFNLINSDKIFNYQKLNLTIETFKSSQKKDRITIYLFIGLQTLVLISIISFNLCWIRTENKTKQLVYNVQISATNLNNEGNQNIILKNIQSIENNIQIPNNELAPIYIQDKQQNVEEQENKVIMEELNQTIVSENNNDK